MDTCIWMTWRRNDLSWKWRRTHDGKKRSHKTQFLQRKCFDLLKSSTRIKCDVIIFAISYQLPKGTMKSIVQLGNGTESPELWNKNLIISLLWVHEKQVKMKPKKSKLKIVTFYAHRVPLVNDMTRDEIKEWIELHHACGNAKVVFNFNISHTW